MKPCQFLTPVMIVAAALALAGVVYAATQDTPNLLKLSDSYAANASKVCVNPPGGWTIINCSDVAAATSAQLNDWSRYIIQCGVNSYFATGDDAADVADANDGYLPAGAWYEFGTTPQVRYVSCLNIGSDSDCRIIECK